MLTILLEVKSIERDTNDFYNPATKDFKKYPRTQNGITKAIQELTKIVQSNDWIDDYRFVVYEGKYKYYKDIKPMMIIDKMGNIINA
jgi:hypothetical protein